MKLKNRYSDISVEKILIDNLTNLCKEDGVQIRKKDLLMINSSMEKIRARGCIDIYIVLYLLTEELGKEGKILKLRGIWKGIIDVINPIIFFCIARKSGTIELTICKDQNIREDQIIIEVSSEEEKEEITSKLNLFADFWQDTFIIERKN